MAIEGWTISSAASTIQNESTTEIERFSKIKNKAETAFGDAAEAAEHFEIGAALDSLLTKFLSASVAGAYNSGLHMTESLGKAITAYEDGDSEMAGNAEAAIHEVPDFKD